MQTDRELIIFVGKEVVRIQESNNRNFAHLEYQIMLMRKEITRLEAIIEDRE